MGQLLGPLFGCHANPSLTEIAAYALYFMVILPGLRWAGSGSVAATRRRA